MIAESRMPLFVSAVRDRSPILHVRCKMPSYLHQQRIPSVRYGQTECKTANFPDTGK